MNRPVVRLFGFLLLLFALLVWKTSQWAVFDADELQAKTQNRRPLILSQTVKRGTIKTADGVTVAVSTPESGGSKPIYVRHYPQGSLYGHPVGYSFVEVGQSGIERSENDALTGERNEFTSIIDQLRDLPQEGDDVTLTIDSHAQQVATQALEQAQSVSGSNGAGAVVAIEPSTGAVKVMASLPGYDPNAVNETSTYQRLAHESDAPLVNRPTQSAYPPGSTMKVVTATAALDSGEFTPSSVLSGRSPQVISGVPLFNAGNEQFGDIDMTTALTDSVNTYFAQVGEQLGTDTMVEYMKRFGFYSDPQLDLPSDEMRASGADTDGRGCRHGRERRRADAPDLGPAGHRSGRANRGEARPSRAEHGDERADRDPAHRHDDQGDRGGNGRGTDGGRHQLRGQDRHGGDRPGGWDQPTVVHRLRARR